MSDLADTIIYNIDNSLEPEFSENDRDEIENILRSKSFGKVLKMIDIEAQNKSKITEDLSSDDSIRKAIKQQGWAGGLKRAIDLMIELAEKP